MDIPGNMREIKPVETSRSKPSSSRRQVINATASRTMECVYCKANRKSFECAIVRNVAERKAILQDQKCTCSNHMLRECRSKNFCYHCKGKHHSSSCTKVEASHATTDASPTTDSRTATGDSNGHIKNGPEPTKQSKQTLEDTFVEFY